MVSLRKAVVGFLLVLEVMMLGLFKNTSMLKKCFNIGTQSYMNNEQYLYAHSV